MPGVAGEVKVIFSADTASYTAAVRKAKEQLGVFEKSATSAGATARREMQEARGTVMVLGEEFGVHLPRHVQKFVASLPGVASAMSAAFSTVAVFAIGAAIFEAGKKVYEFAKKNEEAARKNAEAWRAAGAPLIEANDALRVTNDKLANVIAKIEGKPQNGIKLAIDEAIESADRLSSKLDADLQKIAATLKASSPGMLTQLFTGAASSSDIEEKARDLQDRIQETTLAGGERVRSLRGDPEALSAAQKDLDDKLAELYREGAKFASEVLRTAKIAKEAQAHPFDYPVAASTGFNAQKMDDRIRASRGLLAFYRGELDSLELSAQNQKLRTRKDLLDAAGSAPKVDYSFLLNRTNPDIAAALAVQKLIEQGPPTKAYPASESIAALDTAEGAKGLKDEAALRQRAAREGFRAAMEEIEANERMREAWIKVQRETGRISELTAARALQQIHSESYGGYKSAFVTAQTGGAALARSETARLNAGYMVQEQQDSFSVMMSTPMGMFKDNLGHLSEEFTNLGQVLSETTIRGLETFNDSLIRILSTPGSMRRGTHPWRNMGAGLAESAGGAALRFGEGELMKSIPGLDKLFGKAPTGKAGDLLHVSVDRMLAGGVQGGASSSLSASSFTSIGGAVSSGLDLVLKAFHVPGFAMGGAVPPGALSIVGERGPELFSTATSGRIIPNDKAFGGGHTFNIDATGANDPAATQAAVYRGIAAAAPSIIAGAKASIIDHNRRVSSKKRI